MVDTVNTVIGTVGVITAEEMAELEKGETPILGNKGSFGPKFKKKTREQIHAMHGHAIAPVAASTVRGGVTGGVVSIRATCDVRGDVQAVLRHL